MRSSSTAEVLSLWEQGVGQPALPRALLLLSASVGQPIEEVAQFSIGRRDAQLLDLRVRIFGSQLTGVTTCPTCAEQLEVHFDADDVRLRTTITPNEPLVLSHAGYDVTFRLPIGADLSALSVDSELARNRSRLIELCVLAARRDNAEIAARELPEDVVAAIAQRMSEADPAADIQLIAACPQCRQEWPASLDIASFLWREIEALAQRLLTEVHQLASIYGWSEHEILSLSPARRQFYLSLSRP